MKLKKLISLLVLAMCLTMVMPAFAADVTPLNTEKPNNDARAQQLVTRLKEIRDMDKSNLTSSEKRALRKEVKEMKKEVRRNSNGIYLSVGAIIIIILLLILLL
jgi:predicted PurR-regulated permease PerM